MILVVTSLKRQTKCQFSIVLILTDWEFYDSLARVPKTKAKNFLSHFVNQSRCKTDQPIKRWNGMPRFVKLVENNG
jgi:hypothetical protein